MKYSKILFLFLLFSFNVSSYSKEDELKLKAPIQESEQQENIPSQIDLSTIPSFPKLGVTNTNISLNSSLKLSVDNFIDTKTSMIGDYFKAHVLEDFYIPTNPPKLIIPKGSWVRGRISFLKRPNFFIKSAKITFHIDELVTPLGETLVLDAELDILKPSAVKPTDPQILFDNNVPVPVSNLETSLIGNLLTGKLYALFPQAEIVTINKGQELQIVLQRNIQLTGN